MQVETPTPSPPLPPCPPPSPPTPYVCPFSPHMSHTQFAPTHTTPTASLLNAVTPPPPPPTLHTPPPSPTCCILQPPHIQTVTPNTNGCPIYKRPPKTSSLLFSDASIFSLPVGQITTRSPAGRARRRRARRAAAAQSRRVGPCRASSPFASLTELAGASSRMLGAVRSVRRYVSFGLFMYFSSRGGSYVVAFDVFISDPRPFFFV